MQIKVGDYKLVHSETIIGIKNHPIVVSLLDDVEGDFTFTFNFKKDDENKDARTTFTPINNFDLQVDFYNCDGLMGGGNTELVQVGTLRKIPLFINYRIFDLTDVGKTMIVNFYIKEEVKNGN